MPMQNGRVTFTNGQFQGLDIWRRWGAIPEHHVTGQALDEMLADIGLMMENFVTRDGQNSPSADLPMNEHKHTGVADAERRDQYASLGQLQDRAPEFIPPDNVGGTANAITITTDPTYAALRTGQVIRFIVETVNTGAVTIDVNNIGVKALQTLAGEALTSGLLPVGTPIDALYNGTAWRLLTPIPLKGFQPTKFTVADATPTATDLIEGEVYFEF